MKQRFNVRKDGKRFGSIIAETPEEAIRIACNITARQPEGCEATWVCLVSPEKTVDGGE